MVAVHTNVTVVSGVSVQTRMGPVEFSGTIGTRIIVPPLNDTTRSHQRKAAKPRGRTGLKSGQVVVTASLRSPRGNQMTPIEDS
jgi:hypothetical protein